MSSQSLKRTPLYDEHRRLGARLVDFGGWEMPLHYGSQIEEHHAVRRTAGMFDVSHMLAVDVRGSGARGFLRGLLANDVAKLATPGKALYSCMLREDGGVLDDLIVYFVDEQRFRLVVNASAAEKDLAWILAQCAGYGHAVEVDPRRDLAMIAVQGPQARERVWQVRPPVHAATAALTSFQGVMTEGLFVARTGYTGEDGFEVALAAADAVALWCDLHAAGVAPCGLGARDTLRLEAGMALYGQELDESVTPFEAGLGWTVVMQDERDFIGRAGLLARPPRYQLIGLALKDKGVLRSHQLVRCANGKGEVTSGTYSPTLGRAIALARMPLACHPGQRAEVEVRGRWLDAEIVKYPFVRHGKSLLPT